MSRLKRVSEHKTPYVVTVASGKGGVGKTLTTVNFAVAARRMGHSVLILDGDLGLANVDVVLGLSARYNVQDVLDGNAALKDVIMEGPMGIGVIPSGSGISALTQLSHVQKQQIFDQIDRLGEGYDLLLIDAGAGIADNVTYFASCADKLVVVTTPEPHAMTDAYALIKVLAEERRIKNFDLVVNQARSGDEAIKVADRISEVAMRFLNVQVNCLGHVPFDPQVPKAVMQRRAASEQSTFTVAGQAWNQLARRLLGETGAKPSGAQSDIWRGLLRDDIRVAAR